MQWSNPNQNKKKLISLDLYRGVKELNPKIQFKSGSNSNYFFKENGNSCIRLCQVIKKSLGCS